MNAMRTLRDSWLGFWHGATRPSLTALVIAFTLVALSVLVLVALCVVYITPDFLAGPRHHYLMADPFDRNVFVTAKAFYSPSFEPPKIVILGNSLMVHCVTGEEWLADMVADKVGRPGPVVYNLSTLGQIVWEMEALVERLPPRFDGILIFGVNPGLLSQGIEQLAKIVDNPRFGFSSEAIDNAARAAGLKVPYRTGIYFIDNWRFFLARRYYIARNLFITGPQPYGDLLDDPDDPPGGDWPTIWQQEIRYFPILIRQYDSNKQTTLEVIGRIVAKLKARRNTSFILLEAPINPRWYDIPNGKEFFERYQNDLRLYATEHGMSYLSVSRDATLLATDFMDYEGHIGLLQARVRCTNAIASYVAEMLTKKEVSLRLSTPVDVLQR